MSNLKQRQQVSQIDPISEGMRRAADYMRGGACVVQAVNLALSTAQGRRTALEHYRAYVRSKRWDLYPPPLRNPCAVAMRRAANRRRHKG